MVRRISILTLAALATPHVVSGQGLREVPQRFAYIQPIGLLVGVGTVGVEFLASRTTTVEIGGVGVYSEEDGVRIYGGGPGIGIRQYIGEGEAAGVVVGGRVDGVWLRADNSGASRGFLASGLFDDEQHHVFLGIGLLVGYRWVTTSGWFAEPAVSYEYFAGPRPLVAGSRKLQDELGLSVGVAFGIAW